MLQFCQRCEYRPAVARGPVTGVAVCKASYEYERRTGRPRPAELIRKQQERDLEKLRREKSEDYIRRQRRILLGEEPAS